MSWSGRKKNNAEVGHTHTHTHTRNEQVKTRKSYKTSMLCANKLTVFSHGPMQAPKYARNKDINPHILFSEVCSETVNKTKLRATVDNEMTITTSIGGITTGSGVSIQRSIMVAN